MEKFSRWRDPGTGIQPFLPPKKQMLTLGASSNIVGILRDYVLGPILVVLRAPFLIIISTWLLLMTILSKVLIIPIIQRGFQNYVYFLGCRTILLFCGYWWIQTETVKLKRGGDESKKWPPGGNLISGDVVVANYTSYIDILFLGFRYNPTFVQIYTRSSKNPKIQFRKLDLFQALKACISKPEIEASDSYVDSLEKIINDAKKSRQGPVVLFPEGTTSNNRCLLSFLPVFEKWRPTKLQEVQLVGFKHDYEDFCPCYTAGNPIIHFLRLLCQFSNKLEVNFLDRDENPDWEKITGTGNPVDGQSSHLQPDSVASAMATSIAQLLQLRRSRLTLEDKMEFYDYFTKISQGYKTAKKTD